jgi:predicted Rossmann fold flavoprotein
MNRYDLVVVGGGAAGLFCAGIAGQRGLRVLVLDHAKTLGEKIRISGGGRCNFTNRESRLENFLSLNPHFPKSALSRYSPNDFIQLVRQHKIGFHEKHKGQLFCDDSAQKIIGMLMQECSLGRVSIHHPVVVQTIGKTSQDWQINTDQGIFMAPHLVLATGGLPVPAIGASGFALDIARSLSLPVVPPRPALVPLAFTSTEFLGMEELSGLSLPVNIASGEQGQGYGHGSFDEDLLITHKGLSGPAVLQASSYWQEGDSITVDWSNGQDLSKLFDERQVGAKSADAVLALSMPDRLAKWFAQSCGLSGRKWAEISRAQRESLVARVQHWQVKPAGTLGWKKAEVMLGGVDTRSLDSKTMMAKNHPNLYFIGECVDVTGHLGGHNFQWAWASAHACAMSLG